MRVVVIPHFEQLKIMINPDGEMSRQTSLSTLPGLYAPWPEAREKGFIEMEVEGETLRVLLTELSEQYKQAKADFEPICPITHDLKLDYDVLVNDKHYVSLPHGLDAKLRDGDEVMVQEETLGHC